MTTQLESARQGTLTSEMKAIAAQEGLAEALVLDHVAGGEIVIPCNPNRKHQKIVGIGKGLRTKVNASIGTSSDICDTRLAVRIGDLAKYPDRRENEKQAALARRDMRWDDLSKFLLFPDTAAAVRSARAPEQKQTCTMCGNFCAMKKGMEIFESDITEKR
ncbi:MAG: phosphomethylpyrimidine synthase ThiC [Desulfotignum sp.]